MFTYVLQRDENEGMGCSDERYTNKLTYALEMDEGRRREDQMRSIQTTDQVHVQARDG